MSLSTEYSPADLQACTCGGNGNGDGWGGSWSSWIIIFLIFAIFGWGGFSGNGFGGNGGGVMDGYTLSSDFGNIERKIDGVNNGICDGFYAVNTSFGNLNNTLAQQTASLQNTMTQGFAGLNTGMIQQGYENRIATAGVGNQLASCCCDLKGQIAENKNAITNQLANCCCETQRQIERGFCDTNYALATNTTAITQNAHNDTDRIIARLDSMENTRQQERIAELQSENQSLKFCASQQAQNAYLVNALNPQAIPSYIVPNPYTGRNGYGYGCGCGC